MEIMMKKGRLSKEDMSFIEAKAEVLSPESIAEHLDRDPDSIRDWIKRNVGFSASQKKEAAVANELKVRTSTFFFTIPFKNSAV